MEQDDLNTVS